MKRFSITHKATRYVAMGCNHGAYACPKAVKAVLDFCAEYKPKRRIHLGDNWDMAALMGRARSNVDSKERAASIKDDVEAGSEFVRAFRPTDLFMGNHEHRIDALIDSPNAMLSFAAEKVKSDIVDLAREVRCRLYPYSLKRSNMGILTLGDTKFLHGYMFNVAAIRDHAEAHGRCVISHLHRVGHERGRRDDSPSGYCVGMIADPDKMDYSDNRRQTLAWSQGFAFGEYTDKWCSVQLVERQEGHPWLLP